VLDRVSLLEGVKELVENVLFSLLTRHDIWVLLSVVTGANVVNIELSATIQVNHLKCFLDETLSTSVHGAHNLSQELVIDDLTVVIRVESFKDGLDLERLVSDAIALECFGELFVVKTT